MSETRQKENMRYSSRAARHRNYGRNAKTFNSRNKNNRNKPKHNIDINKYIQKAEVRAEEVPYIPEHSFDDFAIDERIKTNIRSHGYKTPTAIQDQSIEPILGGKDLVGTAQTGTGKTAAFLLPLIDQIIHNPSEKVLIIVPTRELATQIDQELRLFSQNLKIYSAICIGGANINRQIQNLRRNPHFVIATPGRLKDLHGQKAIDLSKFAVIVLDEVDRMLDMGFIHDIQFIVSHLPAKRQSLFFSATLPTEVRAIMDKFLHDPVFVHIDSNSSAKNVEQDVIELSRSDNKVDKLHELLNKDGFAKTLVFTRTKHGANRLAMVLHKKGHRVEAIHGNKSQSQRERALRKFKNDQINVLVATDVAARGIDVKNISHVINFDEPETYQDYIHRIGRTGRGGKTGVAITFVQR